MNRIALTTLVTGLALFSHAFAQDPVLTSGMRLDHPLHASMDRANLGATAAGDFNGDQRPDMAILDGSAAFIAFGPNSYPAIEELQTSVCGTNPRDVAFLPTQDAPGYFLFLSDDGLFALGFDGETNFIHGENYWDQGDWADAVSIEVVDIDGDGFNDDVIAINQTRRFVLIGQDFDVHAQTLPSTKIFVGAGAQQIGGIAWDATQGDEFAVRFNTSVKIVDLNGQVLDTFTTNENTVAMASVSCGAGDERLSFVSWIGGGTAQWLHTVSATTNHGVGLSTIDVTAMTAGDVDADGDDDLIVNNRSNHQLLHLINHGGSNPYKMNPHSAYPVVLTAGEALTENVAEPQMIDLDQDGDSDLLALASNATHDSLVVQRNDHTAEHLYWPVLDESYGETWLYQVIANQEYYLEFDIKPPAAILFNYDTVTVRSWRRPDPQSDAVLDATYTQAITAGLRIDNVQIPIYETTLPFLAEYWLEIEYSGIVNGVETCGPTAYFFYVIRPAEFDDLLFASQSVGCPYSLLPWPPPVYVPIGSRVGWGGGVGCGPSGPPGSGGSSGTSGGSQGSGGNGGGG